MQFLARTNSLADLLARALVFLSSCAMVVLIVIFGWLVFGRYVLNQTPTWVEQLALLLVCYIVFLGSAAGVREETHLGVTFIRDSMPRHVRSFLSLVGDLAMAAFGLVMFIACWKLVQFGWSTKLPMLDIPEGIRTLPAAICGMLIFLFSSLRTISRINGMLNAGDPAQNK